MPDCSAADKTLFEFPSAADPAWRVVNDDVMGGVSTSKFDVSSGVALFRGDGRRYKFTARTESGFDAPVYQRAFTTRRGEWEEHRLAFRDFVPTFRGRVLTKVPPLDATGHCDSFSPPS